ncbi:MAG: PSD1 and planctomycete cytochrome C domain-containing protein [Rhodothermaceae bacterium]|nr:PSD1 and planctomycete cytochrome C domain-containing protein [Rhodothermaceae bacterium]
MDTDVFWLWAFIGRLHPLVVHFPIGVIVVTGILELVSSIKKRPGLREGIGALVHVSAISAIGATLIGLVLANTGTYGGQTLSLHQWAGILTTVLALVTVVVYRRAARKDTPQSWALYRSLLVVSILTVATAGHFGASLTHGDGYLTEVLPWNEPEYLSDSETQQFLASYVSDNNDAYEVADLDRLNLEVRALFAHSCYRCHSSEKTEGDLVLDNKEDVFLGGESGPAILPGNAKDSELVRRISLPRGHEDAMPEKGQMLTASQIELVKRWIDLGAHWADQELKIFPEAELALTEPDIPAGSGFTHPIDRFVDAYFEENRTDWPEVVDDRIFVRRAYLDVVGLLPTPNQVEAFVSDSSPQKRAHLIDTLLDQDHDYTQHWLSFWNDLLRNDYSGTGYITGGRKQISQWLYSALQQNHSYDQIVRDLINPDEDSDGFIRGIAWRGDINNSQRTEMQAAQNISQSLLGVNLKCASCHNSFVSNLTLDQAYGFATIFADSSLEVFRCDKPTGRMSEAAFLYPELGTVDGETVEERLVQLADVIVQPANGRLYRTLVNRYWDRLLGRGIVMPVDEMDQAPWSQELLDWLASDFLKHDTDLKHLIRQIMTSETYQLASIPVETKLELTSPSYAFEGPTRRRLTAEQYADAMSQILGPVYRSVAFDPYENNSEASWIWHRERTVDRDVLPAPGKRYFRHTFDLNSTAPIERADVMISVDHSYELFINEHLVSSGQNWKDVEKARIENLLNTGSNVIAIEGENEGPLPNPAGILFSLKIQYVDGAEQSILSDPNWLSTNTEPASDWKSEAFDVSSWVPVRRYGRFNRSHWNRLIDFYHDRDTPHLKQARASLVTLDPFLKALGRPTRENVATRRDNEATLLQALELTNGDFFYSALQDGASEWLETHGGGTDQLINEIYLVALGRTPSSSEQNTAQEILGTTPTPESIQDFLWVIFMLPEFQVII